MIRTTIHNDISMTIKKIVDEHSYCKFFTLELVEGPYAL